MGRKYINPPVHEAVCEFRFSPQTPWDMAIPGLLYAKVKDSFPIREQRTVQELRINQVAQGQGPGREVETINLMAFINPERTSFIQVGPHLLTIHYLRPYPTWDVVMPEIQRAYQCLSEIVEIAGIERIGLRYINLIQIPEKGAVGIDNYFNFHLRLGGGIPKTFFEFLAAALFEVNSKTDACRVQLSNGIRENPNIAPFVLDLDYFVKEPNLVAPEEALKWVENAHDQIETIFENCLKDPLRDIFQEIKSVN